MEKFRSYQIKPIGKLGDGAFGYVEKIKLYNSSGQFCGFYSRKILRPSQNIIESISLEEIKRRFTREVIYQSHCSHTNVTPIYLFNKYADKPYFVMELAESSLDTEIENKSLDDTAKINIFIMMLRGVKKVHDIGYLHRDIKPQNVLKFSTGMYKISDFGLVKNTDNGSNTTALTAIGQAMGTQRYMAPEILYNAEYSKQTDIFALGKVMEDLHVENKECQSIIQKCSSMDKRLRYEEIDEILSELISIDFGMNITIGRAECLI
ncbi:protein kinase domain-containing protein [Neptunomonas phycophila]|uniref:protein kinase domain-containing protein n=1 Tax=Neptunomonas phycophila TaxID=1572645 RepID=UPI001BE9DDCF|nr:protein kinase [Neptunomonas phycophila]MBT3145056.1 protein kinase [Neptunomonas phycophila]